MSKAITACEEGAQWLWALNLLTTFEDQDLLPTVHLGSGSQSFRKKRRGFVFWLLFRINCLRSFFFFLQFSVR